MDADRLAEIKARQATITSGNPLTYTIDVLRGTPNDVEWLIGQVEECRQAAGAEAFDELIGKIWRQRKLLKRLEWTGAMGTCPLCHVLSDRPHGSDCELAAALHPAVRAGQRR